MHFVNSSLWGYSTLQVQLKNFEGRRLALVEGMFPGDNRQANATQVAEYL